MADSTVIGRSTFVRGRVNGTGDLEVLGRVEGEIHASGEVIIDTSGLVAADITARRIVVRGAVRGNLTAEESLIVDGQARIVGDLRAPRIAIVQGGLVRGHVQTASAGATRNAGVRAQASAPTRTVAPQSIQTRPVVQTPREVPAPKVVPAPAKPAPVVPAVKSTTNGATSRAPAPTAAKSTRVGPPPPVVPVLKKGTKAVQKKRG